MRRLLVISLLFLFACKKHRNDLPTYTFSQAWDSVKLEYEKQYLCNANVVAPVSDTLVFHADGTISEYMSYYNADGNNYPYITATFGTSRSNSFIKAPTGNGYVPDVIIYPTHDSLLVNQPAGEAPILSFHDLLAKDTARIFIISITSPPTSWRAAIGSNYCVLTKL